VAGSIEPGYVGGTEVLNEGVVVRIGFGGGHPGEGLVGAPEEGVVGELLQDAVVVLASDQGRPRARELKTNTLDHPLRLDALEIRDAGYRL